MKSFRMLPIVTAAALLAATVATTAVAAPAAAHFDAEAATKAYMATMTAQAQARSDAYFEGGYWLLLWDFLIGLGLAWLLLSSGISRRMRDLAERLSRRAWLQTAFYAVQYFLVLTLLTLPWSAYEGYFREHQYGMSNQDIPGWLGDQLKALAIALIFGTIVVVLAYAILRRAARTWWIWNTALVTAMLVLILVIGPSLLEPVFNRFYPLADSPLKQQILSLARANGIPANEVYEFDASRQTTKVSAHVSGMLGTARVSLNDNLMKRASPEAVRAVLGHEMGHYVLNHGMKSLPPLALIVVIGFGLLAWTYPRLAARQAQRWGIRGLADTAGLPLLAALLSTYLFAMTPLLNTVTRTMEEEADAFGLNAAREPDGFAQAALMISDYRKMRPGPLEEALLYDHPSGWNRIHRAMVWKAENIAAADIAAYDASHHPPGYIQ
jgi:STE24 endopeptidase